MVSALATEGVTLSGNTWLGISDEETGSIKLNINLNIEIRFHKKSLIGVNEGVWRDVYSGEEMDGAYIPWSNNEPSNSALAEVSRKPLRIKCFLYGKSYGMILSLIPQKKNSKFSIAPLLSMETRSMI